jgi:hypothetical protein
MSTEESSSRAKNVRVHELRLPLKSDDLRKRGIVDGATQHVLGTWLTAGKRAGVLEWTGTPYPSSGLFDLDGVQIVINFTPRQIPEYHGLEAGALLGSFELLQSDKGVNRILLLAEPTAPISSPKPAWHRFSPKKNIV